MFSMTKSRSVLARTYILLTSLVLVRISNTQKTSYATRFPRSEIATIIKSSKTYLKKED